MSGYDFHWLLFYLDTTQYFFNDIELNVLRYYIIYYRYLTLAVHSAPDVVTVDHMETGGEVQTIPVRSVNVEMKISTATNNHVL